MTVTLAVLAGSKWIIRRPRDPWLNQLSRYWTVRSPWRVGAGEYRCDIAQFDTWQGAVDWMNEKASA